MNLSLHGMHTLPINKSGCPEYAQHITGSALALHCCKAHAKINRKIENPTLCKIVTHEDFNLKLGAGD